MTAMKRAAVVVGLFLGVLLAWLAVSIALMPYGGVGGLAAVSAAISEAIVETFVLLVALFVGWRVWRFAQRRRSRPTI
jgi:hypothetical protein